MSELRAPRKSAADAGLAAPRQHADEHAGDRRTPRSEAPEGELARPIRRGDGPALDRLDTIFRVLFAGFWLLISVPLTALAAEGGWPLDRTLPVLLSLVAAVVVILRWPIVVPMLAIGLALAISIPEASEPTAIAPRMLLGIVGFLIVLEFRTREAIQVTAAAALAYVGYTALAGPTGGVLAAIDDAVLVSVLTLTGSFFVGVLVRSGEEMHTVRTERLEAELAASFEDSGAEVAAFTRRLLHDEVIGTLNAVADHRTPRSALSNGPDEALRRDCSRVADSLEDADSRGGHPAGPLIELVAALSLTSQISLTIEGGPSVDLDAVQADAVGRALAEAFRNVARHAGAPEATVRWWIEAAEVHVHVVDGGPAASSVASAPPRSRGFGLHGSVHDPLVGIGGRASLDRTGTGATVLAMFWPANRAQEEFGTETALQSVHRETTRAIAHQEWLVLQVAIPVLVGNGWLALRYIWGDRWWRLETILVLLVALATIVVARRIRLAPLPPVALLILAFGDAAVVYVALELAGGPEALRDYNSFVIGLAVLALTLCAFYLPLGWSLVLTGPLVGVVIVQVVVGGLTLGEGGGAINAAITPPLLGHLFGAYLRWSRQQLDKEAQRTQQLAAEIHRRQLHDALGGRQLARARKVVGPWLRGVADGSHDLSDPATGVRARALAVSMRDDLHVPGIFDDALCARIDQVRAGGTNVVVEAIDEEAEQPGPCLRLLDRVLDLGVQVERVQVRLPERTRPYGEVTVIPAPEPAELARLLRCVEGWHHQVRYDLFSVTVVLGEVQESHDALAPQKW